MIKNSVKATYHDFGLLILRLFLGLAMLFAHGLGKWERLFGEEVIQFADPFGIGAIPSLALTVIAEVICSILLVLGLLTRWALLPLIITMFVAAFVVHGSDGFGGMEKALLFGVSYLTLFFTGSGKYSLDYVLKSKNK